ncbi:MAG: multiprotein bridging factor aMBF1 [Candidatus Nanohaloarchaeota archaeon QJJ-7]|nr:multiprotein bridging factor aMBF1 [Candidatus Nanohaloarchaeota archaeon QJJ-7]
MATCEMCGQDGNLKETKVEGARLKLCEDCQGLGDVVESQSPETRKSRKSRTSTPEEEVLPDYGKNVKQAREAQDMTVEDLADALKEKNSVVKRIESEKLTPDRNLARKFERELGIEIYGEPPETPTGGSTSSTDDKTIGDVADVQKSD